MCGKRRLQLVWPIVHSGPLHTCEHVGTDRRTPPGGGSWRVETVEGLRGEVGTSRRIRGPVQRRPQPLVARLLVLRCRFRSLLRPASRMAHAVCMVMLHPACAQTTLSHVRPNRLGRQKQHWSCAFRRSAEYAWPQMGWTHSPSWVVGTRTNIEIANCREGGQRQHQ